MIALQRILLFVCLLTVVPQGLLAASDPPPVFDFFTLPRQMRTNLDTFLVVGSARRGSRITLNGQVVPVRGRDFAIPVPLQRGRNRLTLTIASADGERRAEKVVFFNPILSTAGRRLAYIDSEAASLKGTIVIDLTNDFVLGFLAGKHARGVAPDGREVYFSDRSVLNSATHQFLEPPLSFTEDIPSHGFLVSPDGSRLYSRDEILDRATRRLLDDRLPESIETGSTYEDANIAGGPAISPDGRKIYLYEFGLQVVDTQDLSQTPTEIFEHFLSDLAVTPDGRFLLLVEYSFAAGRVKVYDTAGLAEITTVLGLGDFTGEVAFSKDGSRAVVGSAGNPRSPQDGGLTVIETSSFAKLFEAPVQLADNLEITDRDEVLVSSGNRAGLDVFVLQEDGKLALTKTFSLGINRFRLAFGEPKADDIRKVVYKRAF